MAKYLFIGNYTADGARGVMKDGGSKRRAVADALFESVGGSIEAFYFSFGEDDFYLIADLPDSAAAAAVSMVVAGSGAMSAKTVVLLSPEEVDRAAGMSTTYTPPGG